MLNRFFFATQFFFLIGSQSLAKSPEAAIQVKIDKFDEKNSQTISPYIYGFGTYMGEDHRPENVWSLHPSHFRFGGNMTERFNWKIDAWNTGADWYFRNYASTRPKMIDSFMENCLKNGVTPMIALPMLGWIAKDAKSGSFPYAKYPLQMSLKEGFGTGFKLNGDKIVALPSDANIPLTQEYIAEWVSHLKRNFGSRPHYYIIGNEPMLWSQTHRDVHPEPTTYDEVLEKFVKTATTVRKYDPAAVIFGPALWGVRAMEESAFDEPGPWSGGKSGVDRARHDNQPFLEWFLRALAREEAKTNLRLLDVIDVHFYPANESVRSDESPSTKVRELRYRATRALWDQNYIDESWIKDRIALIPKMKSLTGGDRIPRKIAIGEYKFYGDQDPSGGVAQAEVLGIFGRYGLDYASYWTVPPERTPVSFAFRMYRNYDGKGAQFGDRLLGNNVGIGESYSVFSAYASAFRRTTVVVLNKSPTSSARFVVKSSDISRIRQGRFFKFDSEKLAIDNQVVAYDDRELGMVLSLPANGMGLLEIQEAGGKLQKVQKP